MRYLGGKYKTRKQISNFLESVRKIDQAYLEPFVGGAWVLQEMSGKREASDMNKALITMYSRLTGGWIPDDTVTEELYCALKSEQDADNPLTAFAGIGSSFGGKWFGGYARNDKNANYAAIAKRSLMKQLPNIIGVDFKSKSYKELQPIDMLVYCDPPYAGTTGYSATGSFDSEEFWQTMREWSINNTVVISEYSSPGDFICVKEMSTKTSLRTNKESDSARVEKLFMFNKEN